MKKTSRLFAIPYALWVFLFVLAPVALIIFKSFFDIPILCKNTYSGIRFPRYDMSTVMISIIPQNNRIVPAERKLLLIPSSCIKYSEECPLENI